MSGPSAASESHAQADQPHPPDFGSAINTNQVIQILAESVAFPKQPVTWAHRLAAFFVACTMLVLPVLYLLFVMSVAWMTWWHATHNHIWLTNVDIRERVVGALLYVGLIAGGAVWVVSLIRPLFARFDADENGIAIPRHAEPVLFAFADLLAMKVGAPRPEVIRLSLDVNASASFDTTMLGLKRRSFTLTLGVPLVAGLTVSQLAGVMAHEFGHFSQRGSSLLDRLIKRVNLWFGLAVYQSNSIDVLIESLGRTTHYLNRTLAFVLRIFVWLGRAVLRLLGTIGLFASASLMRRMEFDADRYEIGLVGSAEYAETSRRVIALQFAHAAAFKDVLGSIHCCYLPLDLAAFIAELADRSPQVKEQAKGTIKEGKRRWLSSHPPTRVRIEAARDLNLPGSFRSPIPSTALFSEFRKISENLTALIYQAHFGRLFSADAVRPTREAVDQYLDATASQRKIR